MARQKRIRIQNSKVKPESALHQNSVSSSCPLPSSMSVVMASRSQPDPDQPDLLSTLPDELLIKILSFCPTHIAARTSLLSRRFRHLWEASPSVHIISYCRDKFIAMIDHALVLRNSSHRLLSLRIKYYGDRLPTSYLASIIAKVSSLNLRHLTIDCFCLERILPSISSIICLQSLSLLLIHSYCIFPSGLTLTCLKSLSLELRVLHLASTSNLGQFLSELCSLENLCLVTGVIDELSLSSQSIKKLKLIIYTLKLDSASLFLPSLESLHMEIQQVYNCNLFHIHGEVPLLQRAVISLNSVRARDVSAVTRLLSFISNVEELILSVKEPQHEKHPIPILLEPGKDVPNFHSLKHLDVRLCVHEYSFEAVIIMLHNCPNLESMKLVHEIPKSTIMTRERKDWESKLPRNADGNHYAFVRNFHSGENIKEFMKLVSSKMHAQKKDMGRHCSGA